MRRMRVNLNGYRFCSSSSHAVLRDHRAKYHRTMCDWDYPFIKSCEFFAPDESVRENVSQLHREYIDEFGEPDTAAKVRSDYIFLKASLAKITSVIGKHPPEEPPFRRYEYDRKNRAEHAMPYSVEYPREDRAYDLTKRRIANERELMEKVVELIASSNQTQEDETLSREALDVLENLEAIGNLAKLLDKLGNSIGMTEGWMKWEVLKSLQN